MNQSKKVPRRSARKPVKPGATGTIAVTRPIKLLLVDDHPVVREGLRSCFARLPKLAVVGEAASGEEALRLVKRLKPDVVLMDINMPGINGLVTAARMQKIAPAAKVLILSVHENREYVAEVARCGARGYILKDAPPDELVRAIESVHSGEGFFSPSIARAMLKSLGGTDVNPAPPKLTWLSARERDVLALIATGATNKNISERLGVAMSTVKTLRERLMRKLDLHGVAALTQFAVAHGLAVSATDSRAK